ncbi:hypothetical protein RD792_010332, partial [Penstemon davidsonii]
NLTQRQRQLIEEFGKEEQQGQNEKGEDAAAAASGSISFEKMDRALEKISVSATVSAFIIDFFCTSALHNSKELKIPTYYFLTSGACDLAVFLYYPTLHGNIRTSFKDMNTILDIPGLPGYEKAAIREGKCNPGGDAPPVFCVGPLLATTFRPGGAEPHCLKNGLTYNQVKGLFSSVLKVWVEVLNHESVGGFMTHFGWNSVLEVVCAGVPMVAWPFYVEQHFNRVVLVEGMKLALRMNEMANGFVVAEEVKRKVRELMDLDSEKGSEIRKVVKEKSEEAKVALKE